MEKTVLKFTSILGIPLLIGGGNYRIFAFNKGGAVKLKEILQSENEADERLLKEQPDKLIIKYQGIIRIIVKKFIASQMFRPDDFDDVVQAVNEDILKKIGIIQKQYNGLALLKTYFSTIVRNSCLKIHEKMRKEMRTISLEEAHPVEEEKVTNDLEIAHDIKRLDRILQYSHKKRGRILLCCKLYFQIPIDREDIFGCFANCKENDVVFLLDRFEFNIKKKSSNEVYQIFTPILNKYENKNNTEDAMRRWTEIRIFELLKVLNASPNRSNYTKESLKILMEKYSSIQL